MYDKWSPMKKLIWLYMITGSGGGGGSGVDSTVSGTSPLSLANALAKNIVSLTQYGKCTQASTPTPSAPVDIKCNNGALTWDSVNQRIYADGTPEVLSITAEDEYEGDIVTFDSPRRRNIAKLSVKLEPVQDLHGYSYPWPAGGGKNKMPPAIAKTETINGVTFTSDGDGNYTAVGTATADALCYFYLPSVFVILSSETNADKPKIALNNTQSMTAITFKFYYENSQIESWVCAPQNRFLEYGNMRGRNCNRYAIQVPSGVTANIKCSPMLVEHSVTDPTFAPYSNICPISGYSEAKVYVSPTQDAQDATVYTIDLDGARYGGTLDVVSGLLTVTHGNIASYAGESLPGEWISDSDVYSAGGTPTTGAQVVYELATPQTIQLTPQQVELLLGENNIWSDAGTVYIVVERAAKQTASIVNLFAVGDYADEAELISGLVTRKCRAKVLDGTESYTKANSGDTVRFRLNNVSDLITGSGMGRIQAIYSHFQDLSSTSSQSLGGAFAFPGRVIYFIPTDQTLDLNGWKSWVAQQYAAGTPVIVLYPLVTETTEQTTPHQLHTSVGTNIVSVTSNVDPVELEVVYTVQSS